MKKDDRERMFVGNHRTSIKNTMMRNGGNDPFMMIEN